MSEHTASSSVAKLARDTVGKRLEGFGPFPLNLGGSPWERDAPVPPRGFLLLREGSSPQDTVPLLPGVCSVVLSNCSICLIPQTESSGHELVVRDSA